MNGQTEKPGLRSRGCRTADRGAGRPPIHIGGGERGSRRRAVLTVCAAFFLAGSAFAAGHLQAYLLPLQPHARSAAPIPVEMKFNWDGTRILEGRLEMEFREGTRVLGHYRSGELALTSGEQWFRMLLPPLQPFSDLQVEVRMKFATGRDAFDLDSSFLSVPTAFERSLVVGWCGARGPARGQSANLERSFLFERFAPPSANIPRQSLATTLSRMQPEDLPVQPLSYTPYDVVVLTADAFSAARERQLRALARWVRGGGSLCVFVAGELQPYHVRFLNELGASSPAGPAFLSGSNGDLLPRPGNISCFYSGLGRSVVATGDVTVDPGLESPEWRKTVAFLWKTRADCVRAIAETGHWQNPGSSGTDYRSSYAVLQGRPGKVARYRPPSARPYAGPTSTGLAQYSIQSTGLGAELMKRLLPRTVRLIPFSAIVGMLLLFLLAIGPLDYFVLGYFRRRRYTWVLFPATSMGFMLVTVLMANHYLGQRDQRRSLMVVDVGRDGTALRWNRCELVFAAGDMQSVTDLKDALWAPLDYRSPAGVPSYSNYQYARGNLEHEAVPPWFDGVLPVHFRVKTLVHQWQPELSRTLSFEPPPVPLLPDWRAVAAAWPSLPAIRSILSRNERFTGDLFAISPNSALFYPGAHGILPVSVLQELCCGNGAGLLSVVSQVSPTGGGNFEDIGGLDVAGKASVLAIVERRGDDIVVYRRFFHGN